MKVDIPMEECDRYFDDFYNLIIHDYLREIDPSLDSFSRAGRQANNAQHWSTQKNSSQNAMIAPVALRKLKNV